MNPFKNIRNFIRVVRRDGFKLAWEKFKYQFAMLQTPEQNLKNEMAGYIGTMVGLLIATPFMLFMGRWYFCFVTVGGFWISMTQFRGKLKQIYLLRDIKKNFEEVK